ncbi:MAG TPA: MFS transporter [Azospirillaceae bacterium]|nr:MFS transporter [Azospirillaceae bacterium]
MTDTAALRRAEDLPLARRVAGFAMLLAGYFFYSYAWNTVDVLRPYIQEAAGLSRQEAGLLYSAQSLGALLGAIVLAQLADRFGRRNLLALITVGYGLALLAGVAATTLTALLAQRLVLGFFLGGVFSCAVGIYVGLFASDVRAKLASVVGIMFSLGLAFQGWLGRYLLDRDWTLMLWAGALPPLLLGLAMLAVIPDDRKLRPWGAADTAPAPPSRKLPIAELLVPERRWLTLRIALLTGLNFLAYQAFFGWATTYLREVRGMDGADIGAIVGIGGLGSALGGFAWGWAADRMGRRVGLLGFLGAAILIAAFLAAPTDMRLLGILYFLALAGISASVVWGPFFAEQYPDHLRATAASIFNWGRIIGFMAPALTAAIADRVGMAAAPMTGALLFLMAAAVWFSLPETLKHEKKA